MPVGRGKRRAGGGFPLRVSLARLLEVVCRNYDDARLAGDFPCHKTFERGAAWLGDNRAHTKPLFLWVETFDPHEPWIPPAEHGT